MSFSLPSAVSYTHLDVYKRQTRENVIVSSLYEVFRSDETCDDRFLWHWLKSALFAKQIEALQEGGVRLYFFFDKLLKSEITMP